MFSFAIMGCVSFRFGNLNTNIDLWLVAVAELMMGLGTAPFFVPILTILPADLEGPEIAEGSGSATFLRTVAPALQCPS